MGGSMIKTMKVSIFFLFLFSPVIFMNTWDYLPFRFKYDYHLMWVDEYRWDHRFGWRSLRDFMNLMYSFFVFGAIAVTLAAWLTRRKTMAKIYTDKYIIRQNGSVSAINDGYLSKELGFLGYRALQDVRSISTNTCFTDENANEYINRIVESDALERGRM